MNNSSITLDIKQLSEEIHLAVKTIRSTLVNNPKALPPRLIIPGQKRLLWLRCDVADFYVRQQRSHGSNPNFSAVFKLSVESTNTSSVAKKKKRGAPTMSERLAKRRTIR